MTTIANNVLQQALSISPAERAWLVHCLLASIEQEPEDGVESEWLALAQQRTAQINKGEAQTVSWDVIKQNIRGRRA